MFVRLVSILELSIKILLGTKIGTTHMNTIIYLSSFMFNEDDT
jgi:Na+/phosphate symporter